MINPNPIGSDFVPNNLSHKVMEQCSPTLELCKMIKLTH